MNINNNTVVCINNMSQKTPWLWIVLYTHNAQVMTHTTNAYIAAAYLAIMLIIHLSYYRGFFFYLGFLSQPFTNHSSPEKGEVHFFGSSPPLLSALQTLISRGIIAESSPMHIGNNWTRAGNL